MKDSESKKVRTTLIGMDSKIEPLVPIIHIVVSSDSFVR